MSDDSDGEPACKLRRLERLPEAIRVQQDSRAPCAPCCATSQYVEKDESVYLAVGSRACNFHGRQGVAEFCAQPVYALALLNNMKRLAAILPGRPSLVHAQPWHFIEHFDSTGLRQRQVLTTRCQLLVTLLARLLCIRGSSVGRHPLRLAAFLLSRLRMIHVNETLQHIATLRGHRNSVDCVAFHSQLPLLLTGSSDKTARLYRLNRRGAALASHALLQGHDLGVRFVAFHSRLPVLATGSWDGTTKLWQFDPDSLEVRCVATLQGGCHAFHSHLPLMATGNMVWLLSPDNAKDISLSVTLQVSKDQAVTCVAFHPSLLVLATGCVDNCAKLWQLSSDCSAASCVATLQGHDEKLASVAFHSHAPMLATLCSGGQIKLWHLNPDSTAASCCATLGTATICGGARYSPLGAPEIVFTAECFHPSSPVLVTGSRQGDVIMWRFNPRDGTVSCVSSPLQAHEKAIQGVKIFGLYENVTQGVKVLAAAFHPRLLILATSSDDMTIRLWR